MNRVTSPKAAITSEQNAGFRDSTGEGYLALVNPFDSDGWLVHRVLAGSHGAFGRLYDRHSRRVYNPLFRLCRGNAAEAEDLAQETFLAAFESLRSWRGEGALTTWLCGIAYRHYATTRRDVPSTEPLDEALTGPDPESDPLAHCESHESRLRMGAAVAALPDLPREAFVFAQIEGFNYKETALLLGIPVGTVQSRLWRATCILRTLARNRTISLTETGIRGRRAVSSVGSLTRDGF